MISIITNIVDIRSSEVKTIITPRTAGDYAGCRGSDGCGGRLPRGSIRPPPDSLECSPSTILRDREGHQRHQVVTAALLDGKKLAQQIP